MPEVMKYFVFIFLLFSAASTSACNVPVFRYALERWKADNCSIVVFHDGKLTPDERTAIQQLEAASAMNDGAANQATILQDITAPMSDGLASLWEELQTQSPELPYVVVRSDVSGRTVNNWRNSLAETNVDELLSSPVRDQLCDRLLKGDSAVWLVLASDRQEAVSRGDASAGNGTRKTQCDNTAPGRDWVTGLRTVC